MPKKVLLLGASGSIGNSCLDIIRRFKDKFELVGFSVHQNKIAAEKISGEFKTDNFCFTKKEEFKTKNEIDTGAIARLIDKIRTEEGKSSKPDIVVNGIAGSAGLQASRIVLNAGIDLALANKETIVNAGYLIRSLAKKKNAKIIPVDSEHSAIFNLMNSHKKENIEKIIITASGGAFRNYSKQELENVKLEDALKHPTWNMGGKITIDSSTLANKALEVIEAVKLFDFPAEKIEVTVHPQSIVHSLVQTKSGEVYAQMSPPDMRNPIFNALSFPEMPKPYLEPLDFTKSFKLEFVPPRYDIFPLLKLGFEAAEKLNLYPLAFNCANEEAVEAFVNKKIKFTEIPVVVKEILNCDWSTNPDSFEAVFEAEKKVRQKAGELIKKLEK